jgi:D-arabinose 1-dehydrogenase-like Zn-dependent alcohol dehydrogenase
MYRAKAYSAASRTSPLASTSIPRRDPTENDVQIEILYGGICHSDLHQVRNQWSGAMPTVYPCVPGHQIVGRVTRVGSAVAKFTLGDLADIKAYIHLLRRDGNWTLVGASATPLAVSALSLMGRRSLSGSPIGGIAATQEMLDFCGQHNITAEVEVIPIHKVNEVYERMLRSDVKYRFSIDMASLKNE